jgi:hypothetical protein
MYPLYLDKAGGSRLTGLSGPRRQICESLRGKPEVVLSSRKIGVFGKLPEPEGQVRASYREPRFTGTWGQCRTAYCPYSRLERVTRSSFLSEPNLVSRRLHGDISRPKTKKADSEKVRDLSETGRQRTSSWHQISYTAPEKKQVLVELSGLVALFLLGDSGCLVVRMTGSREPLKASR